jgi:hypothetical protein
MNTTENLLQPLTIANAPAASKTISDYLDPVNPAPLDAAFASEK